MEVGGILTLKEYLHDMPKENLIRLGTNLGSGFVYCGRVSDIDLESLDDTYWTEEDFVPFADRAVSGTYPSIKNSSIEIVIVDGTESEFAWDDSVEDTKIQSMDGVRALLATVYRQAKDDLHHYYRREFEARDEYVRIIQGINHLEAFFRNDPYGILPDPDAVIDDCRKNAYDEMQKAIAASPNTKKKKGGDKG